MFVGFLFLLFCLFVWFVGFVVICLFSFCFVLFLFVVGVLFWGGFFYVYVWLYVKTADYKKSANGHLNEIHRKGQKTERSGTEMFYLTTHSTHFIYGYMASDIWLRTILIVRKETRYRHIGYSFRLTARVLLYAPSHRQDSTCHGLCYTSRGALASTRNSWQKTVFCTKLGIIHGVRYTRLSLWQPLTQWYCCFVCCWVF